VNFLKNGLNRIGYHLSLFLIGILAGIGGFCPGLSGSLVLVIFRQYDKLINIIANLSKQLKSNIKYLAFIGGGLLCGFFLFSKLIEILLDKYELPTYFSFLGLLIGTSPLLIYECVKKGFKVRYLCAFIIACGLGLTLILTPAQIQESNILIDLLIGVVAGAALIIPGVDGASILSLLGLYLLYYTSISHFELTHLIPILAGMGISVLTFSKVIAFCLKKYSGLTYYAIFGLYLSFLVGFCYKFVEFKNITTNVNLYLLLLAGLVLSLGLSLYQLKLTVTSLKTEA
jgi:putative membrane protein